MKEGGVGKFSAPDALRAVYLWPNIDPSGPEIVVDGDAGEFPLPRATELDLFSESGAAFVATRINWPVDSGEVVLSTPSNKYGDAAKQFGEVAARYPRTRPGGMARYYAALSL